MQFRTQVCETAILKAFCGKKKERRIGLCDAQSGLIRLSDYLKGLMYLFCVIHRMKVLHRCRCRRGHRPFLHPRLLCSVSFLSSASA